MEQAAAIVPGLALGAALAPAAVWSRRAGRALLPHFGVGALLGVAVSTSARFQGLPALVALVVAAVVTGAVAAMLSRLDAALRARAGARRFVLLRDVGVLAAGVAVADLLQPRGGVPLPLGPLGSGPGAVDGIAAILVGVAAALLLASGRFDRLPAWARWGSAGALSTVAAGLAGGVFAPTSFAGMSVFSSPDTVGLGVRAGVAALAGRHGPYDTIGAALGLGLVEALLRSLNPIGGFALLAVAAAGVLALRVAIARGPGVVADRGAW